MTKERFMALLHGDGVIRMESVPLPELAENEVRIKVDCSLVSPGTEMVPVRAFRQKHDLSAAPKRFGYACAGVITEVRGNVKNLKPGDRVAAMGGGAKHANWVNVPVNLAVPIPDRLSFEEATFACLGATSLHAVRQADPQLSDYGLVLGGGLVGNMAAQLSQLSGARVLLWETLAGRRRIARKCRLKNVRDPRRSSAGEDAAAFAAPYGFDFAVFAFGGQATATAWGRSSSWEAVWSKWAAGLPAGISASFPPPGRERAITTPHGNTAGTTPTPSSGTPLSETSPRSSASSRKNACW